MTKAHTEKTSAADKAIGFDFQYYYFLYRLLNLKTGETIGLEVLDDVHSELENDRQILIQLKHSTQTKADGSAKNLTTLDVDIWKTLSNWSKVSADENAGRKGKIEQLNFINKTDFLLVSNKTDNEGNTFLKIIRDVQEATKQCKDLNSYLITLKGETSDEDIQGYMQDVLNLDDEVKDEFFKSVKFDLGINDIIEKCKLAIKEAKIDESKIEQVFKSLDSQIRADNFLAIQSKQKIIISFEEFYKKYRRHFDLARNEHLKINPFDGLLPDDLADQKFIQQLIDIQDIPIDDSESMAKYTRYLLQMQNNLDDWYQSGDLTENEVKDFNSEAKTRWENEYRRAYRNYAEVNIPEKAVELLDSIRKERLSIASQILPTDMSNGQYYRLSDIPEIGWHQDWEEKYK